METRLSDELTVISSKLMLANGKAEILRLVNDINNSIEKLIEKEKSGLSIRPQAKAISGTLKFTQKEISKMATTFKKIFIANGLVAHITKRESGKGSYCYEIRYRANGYKIEVSSTDLATAKRKFLAKTVPGEIEKHQITTQKTGNNLFEEVFAEWYNFKSNTRVTKKVLDVHKKHFISLPDKIKKMPIVKITTDNITECLANKTARMYEEYRSLFSMLFKYASANGYITRNPMGLIPFIRAERKNREALTENEIIAFLRRVLEPKFDKIRQRAYLYYFFGLRASEIDEETRRDGAFLITRNRKRKNGKIEYKKIPIPAQAENLINWDSLYKHIRAKTAGELFHELLGKNKTAYNLRHTFATICSMYAKPNVVDIWMGDSPERLVGRVYTHFPDSFMIEQMSAVKFPIFLP